MREHYVLFSAPINEETANNFIGLLSKLAAQKASRVVIGLNCIGGHIAAGVALHNCMRAMPFKIVTHNIGNVDSIANVVFLAGDERYACKATTFMFHGAAVNAGPHGHLEEKHLLERLDVVQSQHRRMSELIAARTRLSISLCMELFKHQTIRDAAWAMDNGLVDGIREFAVPLGSELHVFTFTSSQP